jgi:hypothetical protein
LVKVVKEASAGGSGGGVDSVPFWSGFFWLFVWRLSIDGICLLLLLLLVVVVLLLLSSQGRII